MKTSDLLRLSLAFMARRKSRVLLTILGVIIGTICIVLMLSVGYSNYSQFADMLNSNSALTQISVSAPGDASQALTDATLASIAQIEHVKAVSGILEIPCVMTCGAYEAVMSVQGVDPSVLEIELEEGSLFPASSAAPMLVIGPEAARQFVNPDNPPDFSDWEAYEAYQPDIDWLNAQIMLTFGYPSYEGEEETLPAGTTSAVRVSGVISPDDMQSASYAYMSLENATRLLMENAAAAESMGLRPGSYAQAIVRVEDMEYVAEAQEMIRRLGYDAYSEAEYIDELRSEQSRQQLQLLLIGLISLLVSAIGIANTMYAGILERRRQIGIMKVLGMKVGAIRRLFLAESLIMGLVGGLIGLGISWIVVEVLNAGTAGDSSFLGMYFSEGAKIQIPPYVALGALGAALLTGAIAGVWPSSKAAKMSPLEAMRAN